MNGRYFSRAHTKLCKCLLHSSLFLLHFTNGRPHSLWLISTHCMFVSMALTCWSSWPH